MRLPDLPTAEPDAITDYAVDFTASIPAGVVLSSAAWSLTRRTTVPGSVQDAAPASRLSGSPAVNGSVTTQRVAGLVDGNDYLLTIAATLDDGQIVEVWTHLSCRSPK